MTLIDSAGTPTYGSSRLIADVGHWARPKDAYNIYFHTSPATILRALHDLPLVPTLGHISHGISA